jgi:peptidyl-tRNA hydrolase, PTH1 family
MRPGTRIVLGLGNPGTEYASSRHNAGWWMLDRLAADWGFGRFRREGGAGVAEGERAGHPVLLVKPLTFMNRSGAAVGALRNRAGFDVARDLLVVVDDVALPPGRARFRPSGSAGGHNGLRSVEAALATRDYGRLRIGVGEKPPGWDLAEWVLSAPPPEDREAILDLLPRLAEGVDCWLEEGVEAAMNRFNS